MIFKQGAEAQPIIIVDGHRPVWRRLAGVLARLVRTCMRHPLVTAECAGVLWVYVTGGMVAVGLVASAVATACVVWRWRWPAGFTRWVVVPVRSWWRGWWVYRRNWQPVLAMCGLTVTYTGVPRLPRLGRVHSTRYSDWVRLRLVPGQSPADFQSRTAELAHGFGARECRVRALGPGLIRLELLGADDPLSDTIPTLSAPEPPDLYAVPVGRCEDGTPWLLRLLGTHVLVVGVTGAGKGSVIWSLLRGVAAGIRSGVVAVWAIDPKGGMELGLGRRMFARFATEPAAVVDLLEAAVVEMRARASRLAGLVRQHTPTETDPLVVVLVDEIASVTAYIGDRDLKRRAEAALSLLLSQGRAVGVSVVGAVQDPRKEVVNLRNLFPTRVALRLDEPSQVDMVLGDGSRDRGAHADTIPEMTPGVGYVRLDGQREPVRVRAAYLTDDDIRATAAAFPAPRGLRPVEERGAA